MTRVTRGTRWRTLVVALSIGSLLGLTALGQSRIASDFEITQMERQLDRSRDFASRVSARLNLGDLRRVRSEPELANDQYAAALALARDERTAARSEGQITRYATATSYASLASAKLGQRRDAFLLAEEAVRYESGSAKSWNLYSSAMMVLGLPAKAAGAARNAVAIATRDLALDTSVANRLDLAVYQYALAAALADSDPVDALSTLRDVTQALDSDAFKALRDEVAKQESFEIHSSARGDAATWLSLFNRANLRIAALYERSGDAGAARRHYRRVLELRTDDATALGGLARLTEAGRDREEYFAAAFDANPFSPSLVAEYRKEIAAAPPEALDDSTTGGRMRRALVEMRHDRRAARRTLGELAQQFPSNHVVRDLLQELSVTSSPLPFLQGGAKERAISHDQLETLLDRVTTDALTSSDRAALDTSIFTAIVTFRVADAQGAETTSFTSGNAGQVRFAFGSSTAFRGTFATGVPLMLTFRVLGATKFEATDALLVEPLRLEGTP